MYLPVACGVQVDPTLSRTVMVSTKFDTRIPQFAIAADAEAFLHPSAALLMDATMLGKAPFFTSVPSGRVGNAKDAIFRRHAFFPCIVCQQQLPRLVESIRWQLEVPHWPPVVARSFKEWQASAARLPLILAIRAHALEPSTTGRRKVANCGGWFVYSAGALSLLSSPEPLQLLELRRAGVCGTRSYGP